MNEETIVAVYDTVAHAELAIADLKQAGVADSAIERHTQDTVGASTAVDGAPQKEGFWSRLFGGEPDRDASVYSRSVEHGASVVTVKVSDAQADHVLEILDRHSPIDLDERAATYATEATGTQTTGMQTNTAQAMGTQATAAGIAKDAYVAPTAYAGPATGAVSDDETIRLSEERLAVGKRLVNRGGTRIRRFVVERPVEENVNLHEERVTLERRLVTDGRPVTDADFSDKTIEMTETAEEAVVSKSAFVTEEIRLRKEATDRVETIRDTVRKEDVEIEQIPGSATVEKTYTPKV